MTLSERSAVIVTGASSGIGRAAAVEFARRGNDLVLAARRADRLEQTAAECRTYGGLVSVVSTDVTDPEQCRRLIASVPRVDVLVNNAGFAILDSISDARVEDLREMMEVNFFGMVHCTQAVLPQMIERRRGTIVNVASIAGLMGFERMGAYGATKFAVVGFSEALRDEVIRHGVRVALVCPGTTDTEFFVRADQRKLPGAARLLPSISAERAARAVCDAAEDGRYRRVLPALAWALIRTREVFPRMAHLTMRSVSRLLERR